MTLPAWIQSRPYLRQAPPYPAQPDRRAHGMIAQSFWDRRAFRRAPKYASAIFANKTPANRARSIVMGGRFASGSRRRSSRMLKSCVALKLFRSVRRGKSAAFQDRRLSGDQHHNGQCRRRFFSIRRAPRHPPGELRSIRRMQLHRTSTDYPKRQVRSIFDHFRRTLSVIGSYASQSLALSPATER